MSRFECLNNNNNNKNNNKNNNWKTKKPRNIRSNRECKKDNKVTINNQKEEINFLDEKNFPSLGKSEEKEKYILKNFIDIVNHTTKTEKIEEKILPGWSVIYKKNNKIIIEKRETINNRYNKELQEEKEKYMICNNILDNRYSERLELNEILGDISPYWDMDSQYDYDTREDEIIDDNDTSDSEYENEDEFY